MQEHLKQILEEINLGRINDISNIKFSIEDYLSKDENGITFLEHLLKNKIKISYWDEVKFGKYIEISFIYLKNGYSTYSFEYNEEDLFKTLDGKRLIDLLIEKHELSGDTIEVIKNHIEIIDILEKKFPYKLNYLNEELVEKLLIYDSNGICPLQKYIDNKKVMNSIIPKINDAKTLIEFCKNNNKYELLKDSNEFVLMYELEKDYTLFDDLISKNIKPYKLQNVPANIDFVKLLLKRNFYETLIDEKEEVLLLKINKKKTLLQEFIEKNLITKITTEIYEEETIKILYKMNRLDLLRNVNNSLLNKKIKEILKHKRFDNRILLDYMLDMGYNPLSEKIYFNQDTIKFLCAKGYYKLLSEKIKNESDLNTEIEDGVLLIDKLLENNCDIDFGYAGFASLDTAKKLYEKNRADLLTKGSILTLLKNVNESETYFDYILENIKNKNVKYNLNDFDVFNYKNSVVAKFYLIIAKHDMMEYVEELTEENLLTAEGDNTLLDELLNLDSELTVNKVLSNKVKLNMKIAIILKSRGIEQKNIDLPLENSNFTDKYLSDTKDKLGIGPLQSEGDYLLKKLKELFDSDDKSDKELVSALISGYRQALFNNYDLYIQELRNLVEIKEKNINNFLYLKSEDNAYFNPSSGRVFCDDLVIETILHETGHALHSYLVNSEIPEDYGIKTKEVRNNPETLKKVEKYSNEYNRIKQDITQFIEEKYKDYFKEYYNDQKVKEIEDFLSKSLIEKKEEFKSLGVSEESLDIILNNYFTVDTYIETQKRIYISKYADAILRSEIGPFMAIGDILDAIYEGELHSKVLKNENGELIKGTPGHGISYYLDSGKGFREMIANFASIVKSKDSKVALSRLKDIIGDDLYTMISEFYYDNIVASKSNKKEEIKLL